jgi:hypothetical protein
MFNSIEQCRTYGALPNLFVANPTAYAVGYKYVAPMALVRTLRLRLKVAGPTQATTLQYILF